MSANTARRSGKPKWHFSKKTGNTGPCNADVGFCPFGDMETEHYATKREAQAAYERYKEDDLFVSYSAGHLEVTPLPRGARTSSYEIVVPRGAYLICDPQLVIGDDNTTWNRLSRAWAEDDDGAGFSNLAIGAQVNDHFVVTLQASAGVGQYADYDGHRFPSESGMIGVIPLSLLQKLNAGADIDYSDYGTVASFQEDTAVRFEDEFLYFGNDIVIDSSVHSSPEDDDYEFDDGYEEYDSTSLESDWEKQMLSGDNDDEYPVSRFAWEHED